jgi:hypothetical protein
MVPKPAPLRYYSKLFNVYDFVIQVPLSRTSFLIWVTLSKVIRNWILVLLFWRLL